MCIEVYATYVCGHTLPIWIPCSYYRLHNCPNFQRQYRARPLRCSATCRAPVTSSNLLIDDEVYQELMESLRGDATSTREMVPVSREQSRPVSGSTSNSTQNLPPSASSQVSLVGQEDRVLRDGTGTSRAPRREGDFAQGPSTTMRSFENEMRSSRAWTEGSSSSNRSGYSP